MSERAHHHPDRGAAFPAPGASPSAPPGRPGYVKALLVLGLLAVLIEVATLVLGTIGAAILDQGMPTDLEVVTIIVGLLALVLVLALFLIAVAIAVLSIIAIVRLAPGKVRTGAVLMLIAALLDLGNMVIPTGGVLAVDLIIGILPLILTVIGLVMLWTGTAVRKPRVR